MTNARMEAMIAEAEALVRRHAQGLRVEITWHDVFRAVVNDAGATDMARRVATDLGLRINEMALPLRWSEDFGRFGDDGAQAALLYIGAGEGHPQLHNPDYDFPDALIPGVVDLYCGLLEEVLHQPSR